MNSRFTQFGLRRDGQVFILFMSSKYWVLYDQSSPKLGSQQVDGNAHDSASVMKAVGRASSLHGTAGPPP